MCVMYYVGCQGKIGSKGRFDFWSVVGGVNGSRTGGHKGEGEKFVGVYEVVSPEKDANSLARAISSMS